MNEIIEFLVRHGYSVLFAWVMAEEVGLPVPSAPILLAAGALAGRQRMYLPLVVAVPVLAATLCDSFWYILGRLRGTAVLRLTDVGLKVRAIVDSEAPDGRPIICRICRQPTLSTPQVRLL